MSKYEFMYSSYECWRAFSPAYDVHKNVGKKGKELPPLEQKRLDHVTKKVIIINTEFWPMQLGVNEIPMARRHRDESDKY